MIEVDQFHATIKVLDHGGATFHPIATVVISRSVYLTNRGRVDVPAQDTVNFIVLRIADDGLLKFPDKADHIFDLGFDIGTQGPVSKTGEAADEIDDSIAAHQQDIADVANMREPAHVLHNSIEFVSVHDKQSAAVRRFVNGVFLKRHARIMPVEGGEEFVVVADNVDDFGSLPAFAQEFLNDIVVFLRPVDASTQGPDIDQVAHKLEGVEFHILQEIQQHAGFASTRA